MREDWRPVNAQLAKRELEADVEGNREEPEVDGDSDAAADPHGAVAIAAHLDARVEMEARQTEEHAAIDMDVEREEERISAANRERGVKVGRSDPVIKSEPEAAREAPVGE